MSVHLLPYANLEEKAGARDAARKYEAERDGLIKSAPSMGPKRAKMLSAARLFDSASRAMYDAGFLYGRGDGVKGGKRKLDALRHASEARAVFE